MNEKNTDKTSAVNENTESINEEDESARRQFFKRFGKYALYTSPAIYLLMHPQKEAIAGSNPSDLGP